MAVNRVRRLYRFGQSVWLDQLSRELLQTGRLAKMIAAKEVSGVTSNPTIFDKAIEGSTYYDEQISALVGRHPKMGAEALYEALVIKDIQGAADLLRPVYERSGKVDGYVSLEVSPKLAYETEATMEDVRRLFWLVGRPNVFIKIPATDEGLPAIRAMLGEGVNVNVTLMFSQQDYTNVARAYLAGLEKFFRAGGDLSRLASVASYFVSRIDVAVDRLLAEGSPLRGRIAIANTKVAYAMFQKTFSSARFLRLREKGARVQRLLCASTSTKNPAYSDVLYAEGLIGPDTINTMPTETLEAFRDHGKARLSMTEDLAGAKKDLRALARAGIDLDEVCRRLKVEGVEKFSESFDALLATLEQKRKRLAPRRAAARR
jgi:transaldolase